VVVMTLISMSIGAIVDVGGAVRINLVGRSSSQRRRHPVCIAVGLEEGSLSMGRCMVLVLKATDRQSMPYKQRPRNVGGSV
jgi:hypothetical protein